MDDYADDGNDSAAAVCDKGNDKDAIKPEDDIKPEDSVPNV